MVPWLRAKAAAVRRINDTIRYMQISVFALDSSLGPDALRTCHDEVETAISRR
jgi:hypothetical protein